MTLEEELARKYFILTAEEQAAMAPVFALSLDLIPASVAVSSTAQIWENQPDINSHLFRSLEQIRWFNYVETRYPGNTAERGYRAENLYPDTIIPNLTYLYPYVAGALLGAGTAAAQMGAFNYIRTKPVLAVLLALWIDGYAPGPLGQERDTRWDWAQEPTLDPEYFYQNAAKVASKIRAVNLYGAEMASELNTYKAASDQRLLAQTQDSESRLAQGARDASLLARDAVQQSTEYEVQYQFALDAQVNQIVLLSLGLENALRDRE